MDYLGYDKTGPVSHKKKEQNKTQKKKKNLKEDGRCKRASVARPAKNWWNAKEAAKTLKILTPFCVCVATR